MTDSDPLARLAALEGVASAMAATRDGIDALLRDRGLRRTTPDLTAESLLRGAHASAVLEGSGATVEAVRTDGGDLTAQAAVRVTTELLGLAPVLARTPLQAVVIGFVIVPVALVAEGLRGAARSEEAR